MPRRQTKQLKLNGFTLVEVQIALLLLVLIMGLLFGALFIASKSWRSGQAQTELIEEKRLVAEFLRHQFGQITPVSWSDRQGSKLIFHGNSDSVLYVGKLPANRNNSALTVIQLGLKNVSGSTDKGKQLELGYTPLDPDKSPFVQLKDRLKYTQVFDQIKTLKFEYFGKQKYSSRKSKWSNHWENKKLLPQLIKVQITMNNDQQWPEMLIPLHVDNVSGFRQFLLQASQNARGQSNNSSNNGNENSDASGIGIEEIF